METLEKIFGSAEKVKVMRLFIFNKELSFTTKSISERAKISSSQARREVNILEKLGLIRKTRSNKAQSFTLNDKFEHLKSLERLLLEISPIHEVDMVKKISKNCRLKLFILSGVFVGNEESRADMLIVGENIQRKPLENTIKLIESLVGKELRYAALSVGEYKYRQNIGDRLIRDLLDYSHKVVLNRIGEFIK